MTVEQIIALALSLEQLAVNLVVQIKAQSGLTDDQIMAQAQALEGANAQTIAALQAKLAAQGS